MVRRSRCATGLISFPDLWVWPRLFHVTLGEKVTLWPVPPHSKHEPVKLLHGPGCWRPHWPQVSIGFPWTACFPLSYFISDSDLFKVSSSLGIGFSRATFSLCWASFFVFNLDLIYDAGYLHSPLVHFLKVGICVPVIICFISPFNPYSKWFILISSVAT